MLSLRPTSTPRPRGFLCVLCVKNLLLIYNLFACPGFSGNSAVKLVNDFLFVAAGCAVFSVIISVRLYGKVLICSQPTTSPCVCIKIILLFYDFSAASPFHLLPLNALYILYVLNYEYFYPLITIS